MTPADHQEVAEMIDQRISAHRGNDPHDKSPCAAFSEHKSNVYWVMGVAGAAAFIVGGFLWNGNENANSKVAEGAQAMIRVETKLDGLKDTLAELKSDVKEHMSEKGKP